MGSKVDVPATTDPTSTDWQNFIAWVEKAQTGKINITFSNMDNTSEPKIQAGSIVEIAGALYSFSTEEAATGWSGIANSTQAYMALSASGDTVFAEWTTTAPTYRDDLQGWYESGTNKRYVLRCYKNYSGAYTEKYKLPLINGNNYIDGNNNLNGSNYINDIVYNSNILDTKLSVILSLVSWKGQQTLDDEIRGTSFGNGIFVAGTTNGTFYSSYDGITWTSRGNIGTSINNIAFGNNLFVAAVGIGAYDGGVFASSDGITWERVFSSTGGNDLLSVAYGDGVYIAGSVAHIIFRSTDGINWSSAATVDNRIYALTYGDGIFVAGTWGDSVYTSTDGSSWTDRGTLNDNVDALIYDNGLYIAGTGGIGDTIYTSPDAITWTNRQTLDDAINAISYGDGLYYAGTSAGSLWLSKDGLTWTNERSLGTTIESISYGDGLFIAGGDDTIWTPGV